MSTLEDIKALAAEATPGPWRTGGSGVVAGREYVALGMRTDADAMFIARSRTDIERLIAALEGVLADLEHWSDAGTGAGLMADQLRATIRDALEAKDG